MTAVVPWLNPSKRGVPRVNRAHPLARGLLHWWPAVERGGLTVRDIVGRADATGTDANLLTRRPGVVSFSAGLTGEWQADERIYGPEDVWNVGGSIAYWGPMVGAGQNTGFRMDGVGLEGVFSLFQQDGIRLYCRDTSNSTLVNYNEFSLWGVGDWTLIVHVFEGDKARTYANGELLDNRTRTVTPMVTSIGIRARLVTAQSVERSFSHWRLWGRPLSDREVRSMYDDERSGRWSLAL